MTEQERIERVQNAMREMVKMGIDYTQMSVLLGGSISKRTLYRWAKGEAIPQRKTDVINIEKLSDKCKG